jgi:hypothetical protein
VADSDRLSTNGANSSLSMILPQVHLRNGESLARDVRPRKKKNKFYAGEEHRCMNAKLEARRYLQPESGRLFSEENMQITRSRTRDRRASERRLRALHAKNFARRACAQTWLLVAHCNIWTRFYHTPGVPRVRYAVGD